MDEGRYGIICWGCVKARAKTATTGRGRCTCGRKAVIEIQTRPWLGRTETREACNRCLGVRKGWS
jgi:hypothetical protein